MITITPKTAAGMPPAQVEAAFGRLDRRRAKQVRRGLDARAVRKARLQDKRP